MRYIVQYAGHMPKGSRFCVARLKIVPSVVGGAPVEVYDSTFEMVYHSTKRAANDAWGSLTMHANHPVYGMRELAALDDKEVAEWVYDQSRLIGIENFEAWFDSLPGDEKTTWRVEYLNAGKSARRANLEKLLGFDLAVLGSIVDMADSHVQDIVSGLEDGTYDKSENQDVERKVEEVGKLQEFIAANL